MGQLLSRPPWLSHSQSQSQALTSIRQCTSTISSSILAMTVTAASYFRLCLAALCQVPTLIRRRTWLVSEGAPDHSPSCPLSPCTDGGRARGELHMPGQGRRAESTSLKPSDILAQAQHTSGPTVNAPSMLIVQTTVLESICHSCLFSLLVR